MSPDREEASEPPDSFRRLLELESARFEFPVAESVQRTVALFLAELDRWRRQTNLTGRLSARELVDHALQSMLGATRVPRGAKVIDIGSGAGFPGVPLAIVRTDANFTLLEARSKKSTFLRHVVRTLSLANVDVVASRLEDLRNPEYDVATSRAVEASVLTRGQYLRPHGLLLCWTTTTGSKALESPSLSFEDTIRIPYSRNRVIAALRRR
jgi:16S rRNA (guanine527-N7)-methyltransferase